MLRTLFLRCGRLEAYFLAKLLLQKAGLGYEYQGHVIARLLADQFSLPEEQVSHAMAGDVRRLVEVRVTVERLMSDFNGRFACCQERAFRQLP